MNKQISLQASENSSLLELMGKGAAGTIVCCTLLPGISHSAVLSPTTQGTQTHRSQYLPVRTVSLQVPRDIWILEGKC